MNRFTEEADDIQFSEPILAQKGVKCEVVFAEHTEWAEKDASGQKTDIKHDACKVTLKIADSSVRTEHTDAKPKLTLEDQFNIVAFPYYDKKTGEVRKLGRQKLYQLEEAFGFEPKFQVAGQPVEAHITKSGRKVAPKIDGVKRIVNPDFFNAYYDAEGRPMPDNWIGKVVYADIKLTTSEQFGSKNEVDRYVRAPQV